MKDARQHDGDDVIIVYIGDYIDRGPDSSDVIQSLLDQPVTGARSVVLRGNHEQALLNFADGDLDMGAAWIGFGGAATLASYGVPHRFNPEDLDGIEHIKEQILDKMPQSHWTFLRETRPYYACGNYMFVHAGIRPGTDIEHQSDEDLLWIRDEFLTSRRVHDNIIVHGHSIVDDVEFHANRIAIDTGAFATGMLSCLVLKADSRSVLKA